MTSSRLFISEGAACPNFISCGSSVCTSELDPSKSFICSNIELISARPLAASSCCFTALASSSLASCSLSCSFNFASSSCCAFSFSYNWLISEKTCSFN